MTFEEKKDYFQRVYRAAVGAGLCANIKQFAEVSGFNYTSLSSAMNGSEAILTDKFIAKIHRWAVQAGLEVDEAIKVARPQNQQGGVWIPPETLELYNNIAATCRNLSEILKKNLEE